MKTIYTKGTNGSTPTFLLLAKQCADMFRFDLTDAWESLNKGGRQ